MINDHKGNSEFCGSTTIFIISFKLWAPAHNIIISVCHKMDRKICVKTILQIIGQTGKMEHEAQATPQVGDVEKCYYA